MFANDRQRKAMFARMGSTSFFDSSIKFARKSKVDSEAPKSNESGVKILDDYEYEKLKKRGMIGVPLVERPNETLNTYKGEVLMQYNPVGAPYVTDESIHAVSKPHPPLYGGRRNPLRITAEEFDKDMGVIHVLGSRDGFNEDVYLNINKFPSQVSKVKNIRKLLANSEYLDKLPTVVGVEAASGEESGSVARAISSMPLETVEQIRKDAVRENRMDEKIKEAMGIPLTAETVEIPSMPPERESNVKVQDFIIESSEPIKGDVIKDISEEISKPVEQELKVEMPVPQKPLTQEFEGRPYNWTYNVQQWEIV